MTDAELRGMTFSIMARKNGRTRATNSGTVSANQPPIDGPPSIDAMIRQGRQAIDDYDFELARTILTRALELSGGAEIAAEALLVLLVDHLAADHEALEIAGRLSREAQASQRVQFALALAAARSGARERAKAHLAHLDGTAAAEVLVMLAETALAAGSIDEAAHLCEQARSHDAAHPGVQQIARRILQIREELRRPLEAAIEHSLARGRLDEARHQAEQLLVRFPESSVARRAIRVILDHQRTLDAERRVQEAEETLSIADLAKLRSTFHAARAAVAAAPRSEKLALRLATVESEIRAREVESETRDAMHRIADPDRRAGLTHFTTLSPELKRRVREAAGLQALNDLDQILSRRVEADDAVAAVLALEEAASCADIDPAAALQKISVHERALSVLTSASRLSAQLRLRLRDDQRRQLSELLALARRTLDAADASGALQLLEGTALRGLDPSDRNSAEALRDEAKLAIETRDMEAAYETLLHHGDPLAAYEVAQKLLTRAGNPDHLKRLSQVATAREAARRTFGLWISTNIDYKAEGSDAPKVADLGVPLSDRYAAGLDSTGQSLVLVDSSDHWLFIQIVDTSDMQVRARAVLRTPSPLDWPRAVVSSQDTLVVHSMAGVLELSIEDWSPKRWRSRVDLAADALLTSIVLAPEERFVWTRSLRAVNSDGRTRIVDLERKRTMRELSDVTNFWPIAGAAEPVVACSRRNKTLSLHYSDGTPVGDGKFELQAIPHHVLIHPAQGRLLVLVGDKGDDEDRIGFVEIDAAGQASSPRWLDNTCSKRPWFCATSLAEHMTFVVARGDNDQPSIHALRAAAPSLPLQRAYQAPILHAIHLAQDPSSRIVLALLVDGDRLHLIPLGSEPPVFPSCSPKPSELNFLQVPGFNSACTFFVSLGEEHFAAVREIRSYPDRRASDWMQRQIESAGTDIEAVLGLYHVLQGASRRTLVERLLCWMQENLPSDPHTVLLHAVEHVRADNWAEVSRLLESVNIQSLLPEYRRHTYHLFGLALLREGKIERAITVIEAGQAQTTKGSCKLVELLEVIRPHQITVDHDKGQPSPLGELRAAIREADACLHRDDLTGARAAIDQHIVWQSGEVQSLARLAEVELRSNPGCDHGRFRKALALARFLAAHRASSSLRKELPLWDSCWPATRVADLEVRANAWLDRLGTPETPCDTPSTPSVDNPPAVTTPPAWSLVLREIGEALDAIVSEESAKAPARLAFRIRHSSRRFEAIEVLLQRKLRSGRFSAGQLADAGDLLAAVETLSDDADAAAVIVLTEGVPQAPRARPAPSRGRMLRLLATLVGHPRVSLADHPDELVMVESTSLGLELVDAPGGLAPRFALGRAHWTADELLPLVDSSLVIDVDSEARVVTLAPIGAAVLALIQALVRHNPVFPDESHGELRRRLGALQHGIHLRLPDRLAGTMCESDSRPVARLTPENDISLFVEIGVRPVPGGIFGLPGEGSRLALGAVEGRRLAARRDLVRERSSAEHLLTRLALNHETRDGKWRYRVRGEEPALALVESLAEMGDEVVVEWPKDARGWRWLGRATSKELRVRIARTHDLLSITGGVELDGHRIELATLLEAIARGRRYVLVGPHAFIALSTELRERLEAAEVLLHGGQNGLEAALSAAPVLADLEDESRSEDAGWQGLRERAAVARTLDPEVPSGLQAELRPYQLEGFRWLARLSAWAAGACLADDMGLGKTLQALALLVHRAALGPALVIAPISVTPGWVTEAARFAPGLRVRPYRGANREALLADAGPGDLLVAGYGVITRDADALTSVHFSTLILDEAHSIKNAATRRAQAVGRILADFRVALTGTPVENHLGELWSLFRIISPGLLGTWTQFRERFAVPIERDQSAVHRAALGRLLRPFMLRRTKETVLPELPPLIEVVRSVCLSAAERELYETARLAATNALAEAPTATDRFTVLAWLTRLRRLSCHPRLYHDAWTGAASKLDAFLALVEELRATGHRALVFSQFTDHLMIAHEALVALGISVVYLDGTTPLDQRARAVEMFQRGTADLFLISLKAGGTGLNLTAADHVIHLDPWWNPAVEDQATDRAHRIGQDRPVTVIRLIAQDTIEEAVLALHAEKRDLADRLLEGSDIVAGLSAAELVELVRRGATSADHTDDERASDHESTEV